jgi:hypothetical protein
MDTSFLQGNGIEALSQFLTSLAIGLLIGLEREGNPSAKPACAPLRLSHSLAPSLHCCLKRAGLPG